MVATSRPPNRVISAIVRSEKFSLFASHRCPTGISATATATAIRAAIGAAGRGTGRHPPPVSPVRWSIPGAQDFE